PEVQAQDKPPAADKPQLATDIPAEITTPDKLATRLGTLEFKDGAPSAATVEKVYVNLDFTHVLLSVILAASKTETSSGIPSGSLARGRESYLKRPLSIRTGLLSKTRNPPGTRRNC